MATQESLVLPAPQLPSAPPLEDKWQREFRAFQRLLPGLLATHAGKYVLIHDERVFASGTDELAMALDFFAHHGNVPIHIGLVTAEPEPIARIPHYRMIHASEPT